MKKSLVMFVRSLVQHYDHDKYWDLRSKVVNGKGCLLRRVLWLYRIKRMDAKNGASMGTYLERSASFAEPPSLPHGLYGIIVSRNAVIGRNATIYHQVTIGVGRGGSPVIGDNVYIGAGAKIIGNVHVGNNVKIGANCVVFMDVPDNCTVVMPKPRIIRNLESNSDE